MGEFNTGRFAELEAAMMAAWEASRKANAERPMSYGEARPDPHTEAIEAAWHRSGVPSLFLDVPDADSWGWAYISGPVGVGKSYLAASMLRRFIDETCTDLIPQAPGQLWSRPKGYFCSEQEYVEHVKAAFKTSDDRAIVWRDAELLVLDDLGQERPTEWSVSRLMDLVGHRHERQLPTIFTSQYPLRGIEARLAEGGNAEQAKAIASRLMGVCRAIRLDGQDRRRVA